MSAAEAAALAERAAKILEGIYDKTPPTEELHPEAVKAMSVLENVYDQLATEDEKAEAMEEEDMESEQDIVTPVSEPAPVPVITNHQPEFPHQPELSDPADGSNFIWTVCEINVKWV